MIASVKALAAGLLIGAAQLDPFPVDQQRAEMYFREAKELCDRDNARLWGVSLWKLISLTNHPGASRHPSSAEEGSRKVH